MIPHRRLRAIALSLAAGAIAPLAACSKGEGEAATQTSAPAWTEDPRLVELLSPCPNLGHFSGDTSDMLPVLVGKLMTGSLEVIRNFREELAAAGEAAIPALDALVRRSYTDRHGAPALRNVLGILRQSKAESAHDILRRCLEHPNEDIRTLAAAGLAEHPRAEDYEVLSSVLSVAAPAARSTVLRAMQAADPGRFARDFAAWLAAGSERDLWLDAARMVAASAGESAHELFPAELRSIDLPAVRAFLLAALVRAGDEEALVELRGMLAEGERPARTAVLEALEITRRWEALLALLEDRDPVLALRAASLLAPFTGEPQARAALRAALRSPDEEVRSVALEALLKGGDAAAADFALSLLREGQSGLRNALFALRNGWESNPGLAERVLVALGELEAERAELSLEARAGFLKGIGQVPLAAAAELLLERARAAPHETIDRMSAHRWLAREAGNTAAGRAVLHEAWRTEADAMRRMDLLEGTSFGLDDAGRDFLLEVVDSAHASPWEVLYAAERAARQGPAQAVAPLLKRVALRHDHPVVRPALDCLLWRWYGAE